jgi:hypothetical protein
LAVSNCCIIDVANCVAAAVSASDETLAKDIARIGVVVDDDVAEGSVDDVDEDDVLDVDEDEELFDDVLEELFDDALAVA